MVPEAALDAAHGGDDFQSGHSARLADYTIRQTSLHNDQVGGLEMRRIRLRCCHREEGCIVEMVGEGDQSRNLAGVGFHRKVVVGYRRRHMEAVAGLKAVVHMEAGTDLKAAVRMVVVGLKVCRREVVGGLETGRMSALRCRMIAMEEGCFGWHKGGLKMVGCMRYDPPRLVDRM